MQIYDYYYIYTKEQLKKYCKKDTTQIKTNISNKREFAEYILKIIEINKTFLNNLETLFKKDLELFDTQIEFINENKNYKTFLGRPIAYATYKMFAEKYQIDYKNKSMKELQQLIYSYETNPKNDIQNGLYIIE